MSDYYFGQVVSDYYYYFGQVWGPVIGTGIALIIGICIWLAPKSPPEKKD